MHFLAVKHIQAIDFIQQLWIAFTFYPSSQRAGLISLQAIKAVFVGGTRWTAMSNITHT